ncbi:MAG: spondin domain-containing protein [Bdellovibrionales bacterium]|nr:spondin domain-containing protein [Bdellovibrionales bacterium]
MRLAGMCRKFKPFIFGLTALSVLIFSGCGGSSSGELIRFLITIDNIGTTFPTSQGDAPVVWAPTAVAVHRRGLMPYFTTGGTASAGLEMAAEDGAGMALADEANGSSGVRSSTLVAMPLGETEAGPITPGKTYTIEVEARQGEHLSFVSMFGQSNDWFMAPADGGIELFDNDGNPIVGDVTSQVVLWDAGTEVNEEPGVGPNQAPRQSAPNTGDDENGVVRTLNANDFPLPAIETMVQVTIEIVG